MYCHRSLLTLPIGASLVVDCPRVPSTFSSLALEARTHCLASCLSLSFFVVSQISLQHIGFWQKALPFEHLLLRNNGSRPRVAINTVNPVSPPPFPKQIGTISCIFKSIYIADKYKCTQSAYTVIHALSTFAKVRNNMLAQEWALTEYLYTLYTFAKV